MVNKKLFDIAAQLGDVVKEQMGEAQKALSNLPEGDTKKNLATLLRKASSGKISHEEAQKEIQKILKDAN